jgi:hypothetical protein
MRCMLKITNPLVLPSKLARAVQRKKTAEVNRTPTISCIKKIEIHLRLNRHELAISLNTVIQKCCGQRVDLKFNPQSRPPQKFIVCPLFGKINSEQEIRMQNSPIIDPCESLRHELTKFREVLKDKTSRRVLRRREKNKNILCL